MDPGEAGRDHSAVGHGVADSAAERVHEVFFRVAIGRKVAPFAALALLAVVAERVLQPHAPRVDREVVGVQLWSLAHLWAVRVGTSFWRAHWAMDLPCAIAQAS
jgi:hypothetical protein